VLINAGMYLFISTAIPNPTGVNILVTIKFLSLVAESMISGTRLTQETLIFRLFINVFQLSRFFRMECIGENFELLVAKELQTGGCGL
jgi:hypothetical protein